MSQKEKSALFESFPCGKLDVYDFSFRNQTWSVGLKTSFPDEVKRRVGAAVASVQAGYAGVDYLYKQYFKDLHFGSGEVHPLSRDIPDYVRRCTDELHVMMVNYQSSTENPKIIGKFASEWTLTRLSLTFQFLRLCEAAGYFYEGVAVGRMLVEQLAWCCRVSALTELDEVSACRPESCISALNVAFRPAGRLYGWLSQSAHWYYPEHTRAMRFDGERIQHCVANSEFRVVLLALNLVLLIVSLHVVRYTHTMFDLNRRNSIENWISGGGDLLTALANETQDDDVLWLASLAAVR